MQFLQDGHFGATLSGQLVPQHAVGSRRRLFDADRVRGGADQVESDVEWLARVGLADIRFFTDPEGAAESSLQEARKQLSE